MAVALVAAANPRLLRFDPAVVEVDTVRYDSGVKTVVFNFTNISDKTVSILEVMTQCGCAKPVFNTRSVAPGGKGVIKVEFDPKGLFGEQERHLTVVASNGDYTKYNTITVHGYVENALSEAEIRFPCDMGNGLRTDVAMVSFRHRHKWEKSSQSITLFNDSDKPVSLSGKGGWRFTIHCPGTIEPHSRAEMTLEFRNWPLLPCSDRYQIELYVNGRKAKALDVQIAE